MNFSCRFCKSQKLVLILDFGFSPLGNRFLSSEDLQKPETYYPLELYLCESCSLSQLGYVPPSDTVYNPDYAYEAGITKKRREHHFEMAKSICERFAVPKGSFVVDIGSNVGVLLEGFKSQGMDVLGVDASDNVADIARKKGIDTITGFFGESIAGEITQNNKAKVVTATNVFAHLNNYVDFMNGIKKLLDDDGIFVFQVHYFLDLVENLQYDMIFHEHILFESVKPLTLFFDSVGMQIFDVERKDIDGGTIRCFACRKGERSVSHTVQKLLEEEKKTGIHSKEKLLEFAQRVKNHREEFFSLLYDLKKKGKRIVAISMPAKGVALFNYCKINDTMIEYATERSALKIGKFAPGSHIPVKPDSILLKDMPDYAVLLAWNFEKEIIENNMQYLQNGGKFIVPIPKPRIVEV